MHNFSLFPGQNHYCLSRSLVLRTFDPLAKSPRTLPSLSVERSLIGNLCILFELDCGHCRGVASGGVAVAADMNIDRNREVQVADHQQRQQGGEVLVLAGWVVGIMHYEKVENGDLNWTAELEP